MKSKIVTGTTTEFEDLYYTDKETAFQINQIKNIIYKTGFKLEYWDDDTLGMKDMGTNFGLCKWQDKYHVDSHKCPFDKERKKTLNGCFWSCAVFKGGVRSLKQLQEMFEQNKKSYIVKE